MTNDQRNGTLYDTAVANGCTPIWADGILGLAWHCGCPDNLPNCDQQCSAISTASSQLRRK